MSDDHVVVWAAPKDARLTCEFLTAAGLQCVPVTGWHEARAVLREGVGVLILAGEILTLDVVAELEGHRACSARLVRPPDRHRRRSASDRASRFDRWTRQRVGAAAAAVAVHLALDRDGGASRTAPAIPGARAPAVARRRRSAQGRVPGNARARAPQSSRAVTDRAAVAPPAAVGRSGRPHLRDDGAPDRAHHPAGG